MALTRCLSGEVHVGVARTGGIMTGSFTRWRDTRRPGGSAGRLYEARKRAWRARHRKLFVGGAFVVALIYIGTFIPARHHIWPYIGGMLSGGALAFYMMMRESPPAWIENYQVGAFGEERTAKVLAPLLKQGWIIVHDISRIKSNLDHVAIGPGGVFVLDTKNLQGTAHAEGDMLSLTRPGDTRAAYTNDNPARQARAQGAELNQVLRQRCQLSPWVTAVVVIWADFPQRSVAGHNMTYVHGDHLVAWLHEQPARLNANQVAQISGVLQTGQRRRARMEKSTPA